MMTDYQKQALDFLAACNATMEIKLISREKNLLWNDTEYRYRYYVTITTPQGNMNFSFWGSIYDCIHNIDPTKYDILACLEKYDVGDFEKFVSEFGYDIEEYEDKQRAKKIYNAVIEEYNNLCRIFTPEQMEMMREIY